MSSAHGCDRGVVLFVALGRTGSTRPNRILRRGDEFTVGSYTEKCIARVFVMKLRAQNAISPEESNVEPGRKQRPKWGAMK